MSRAPQQQARTQGGSEPSRVSSPRGIALQTSEVDRLRRKRTIVNERILGGTRDQDIAPDASLAK